MSEKTYTDPEVQALVTAAVAEATKDLSAELESLKSSLTASESDAKIAQIQADADEKVADLQAQLDAKVIEAQASKTAHDELVAYLEGEATRVETEAAAEARKEERVKAVSEAASFPEEYVTANTDRWAAMDDEAFELLLADYKSVSAKSGGDTTTVPTTALTATRDATTSGAAPAARALIGLRREGVDPRQIVR